MKGRERNRRRNKRQTNYRVGIEKEGRKREQQRAKSEENRLGKGKSELVAILNHCCHPVLSTP